MNNKGFSVLSVIASIFILGIIIMVVSNFNIYTAIHKKEISEKQTFYSEIDNEMTLIYSSNWEFGDKTIKTDMGNVLVSKVDGGVTEYGTRKMEVEFKFKNLNKKIEIERSQYYE